MVIMSSDARGLGLNILQFTRSYLGDNLQFLLRKCTHGGGGGELGGAVVGCCYCPQMFQYSGDFGCGRGGKSFLEITKPGPGLNLLIIGAGDILHKNKKVRGGVEAGGTEQAHLLPQRNES